MRRNHDGLGQQPVSGTVMGRHHDGFEKRMVLVRHHDLVRSLVVVNS